MFVLVLGTGSHSVSKLKNNQRLTGTVWETKGGCAKAHGVRVIIRVKIKDPTRYVYAKLEWLGEMPENCPETVQLLNQTQPGGPDIKYT